MTEIETLFNYSNKLSYPKADMKVIEERIPGLAFFPGGKGTVDLSDTISDKSIMILGQDFDYEDHYLQSLSQGRESKTGNPTWRNILKILKEVNINPENCFFTNAIMGVRVGNIGTGQSPAFKHPDFIKECQNFFLMQLKMQKPKAIFILGKYPAEFLAGVSEELDCWSSIKTFATVDQSDNQVKTDVSFKNGIKSNLVLLVHPSLRHLNIKTRTYKDFPQGHPSEIAMVKSVL